ncbi:MAG TPA: translation initiation factor [Flavitalea sp.]|nr:translation initiation factor [Flavitalea sp.]
MKKKTGSGGVVFSTDPSFIKEEYVHAVETLPEEKQPLRIKLDKKQRAGRAVTLVLGFTGTEQDLETLGRTIKNFTGVGGSVKKGEIIIQGDQRDRLLQWLQKNGYAQAKITG